MGILIDIIQLILTCGMAVYLLCVRLGYFVPASKSKQDAKASHLYRKFYSREFMLASFFITSSTATALARDIHGAVMAIFALNVVCSLAALYLILALLTQKMTWLKRGICHD